MMLWGTWKKGFHHAGSPVDLAARQRQMTSFPQTSSQERVTFVGIQSQDVAALMPSKATCGADSSSCY